MTNVPINYYHCYATANDDRLYKQDIKNLINISRTRPLNGRVSLYIAISLSNPTGKWDGLFEQFVTFLFKDHPYIVLSGIYFKSNVGRDFSSYELLNSKVQSVCRPDDYIFFQNRSAYGPYKENWFQEFINLYESAPEIRLVGSTINFADHPSRSREMNCAHVQTYAFLARAKEFAPLVGAFPAMSLDNRADIIIQGEIGLSRYFMKDGGKLACLEWPDVSIDMDSPALASKDIKKYVSKDHPFYHRRYFKKNSIAARKFETLRALAVCSRFILAMIKVPAD